MPCSRAHMRGLLEEDREGGRDVGREGSRDWSLRARVVKKKEMEAGTGGILGGCS